MLALREPVHNLRASIERHDFYDFEFFRICCLGASSGRGADIIRAARREPSTSCRFEGVGMNRALRRQQEKKRRKGSSRRGRSSEQLIRQAFETLQGGDSAAAYEKALEALKTSKNTTSADQAAELAAHAALSLSSVDDSVAAFSQLSALRPDDTDILNDFGGVLSVAGRFTQAEDVYRQALALQPGDGQAMTNLGQSLMGQERYAEAETLFREAIAPGLKIAGAFSGLGAALEAQERVAEAVDYYRQAYLLEPDKRGYRNNYEQALVTCGIGFEERERMYRADLFKNADDFDAAKQLACVMRDTERLDEAGQLIAAWLAREADLKTIEVGQLREILSELQFLENDFTAAWPNYHWRHQWRDRWGGEPVQPEWQGEPLAGKSIFVYAEQGVGDQVMFMALMPVLLATGARVVLECDPRLVALFARSFPDVHCVPVEKPPVAATLDPDIDFHVAMGSLAGWLWQDFQAQPRQRYIEADAARTAHLRETYQAGDAVRLIGISWGSPLGKLGPVKSIALADMQALFALPGTRFVDLQYGDTQGEREALARECGVQLVHDDNVDQWQDLDGFAAQIAAMDAVVSVSNSTAHMAGALGVPSCVLLSPAPQWKWGGSGADSQWYENVRLIRRRLSQTPHDQIAETAEILAKIIS